MRRIVVLFWIATILLAACRPALPTNPVANTPARITASLAPLQATIPPDPSTPTAQPSPTPRAAEPVSANNANQLGIAAQIGYGTLLGATFLANGELLVSSSSGVYRFTADLSNPRKISASPLRDLTSATQGLTAAGTSLTDNEIILLPLSDGAKEVRISFSSDLYGTRYVITPDGSQLVTLSTAYLLVYDARSGKQLRVLPNNDVCGQVQVNPDGQSLVCYTNNLIANNLDRLISVKDLQSGESLARYKPDGRFTHAFSLAQDGRMAINNETMIDIYPNASIGQPAEKLVTNQYYTRVDLSPNGALLAASLGDRIDLWDVKAKKLLRSVTNMVGEPAFSPDSQHLLVWNAGGLALFNTTDLTLFASLPGSERNPLLLFSPDSNRLIELTGSMLQSWETASHTLVQSLPVGSGERTAATYYPNTDKTHPIYDAFKDNPVLLIANERSNNLTVYDPIQHTRIQSILDFNELSSALTFSSDNELVLFGQPKGTVAILNLRTGEPVNFTGKHTDKILALTISPDKRFLLTLGADKQAIFWEIATSQALRTVELGSTERGFVAAAPLGNLFLAGDSTAVHLFGDQPGMPEQVISCQQCLASAFSPDGRLLAVADGPQIRLYNVADARQPLVSLPNQQQKPWRLEYSAEQQEIYSNAIVRLVFSPDGKWLASGSAGGQVTLWSTAPDAALTSAALPSPTAAPKSKAVTEENALPYGSALPASKETINAQNLEQLVYLGRWGERGLLRDMDYAPDGKSILVSSALNLYRIDLTRPDAVLTYDRPGNYNNVSVQADGSIAARDDQTNLFIFNPDGKLANTAGRAEGILDPTFKVKASVSNQQVTVAPVQGDINQAIPTSIKDPQITLSTGGQLMALSNDFSGELEVWDLASATTLFRYKTSERLSGVTFSPDASLLSALSQTRANDSMKDNLLIWKTGPSSQPAVIPLDFVGRAITISQDNQHIAVSLSSTGGGVKIFNSTDGSLVQSLETPSTFLLRFSPDGKSLAIATSTSIEVYDLASGKQSSAVNGFSSIANDFQTVPGTSLVAARVNGGCTVYDTSQGKILFQQEFGTCLVTPDGKKVVVNSYRGFLVYTLPDFAKPLSIPSDTYYVNMHASKDGALLAGLSPYYQWKGVTVFDLTDGQVINTLELPKLAWKGLDFSPDGKLVTGSNDNSFSVWDVRSGKKITEQSLKSGNIFALRFLPSEDALLVSTAQAVEIWDLASFTPKRVLPVPAVSVLAIHPDSNLMAMTNYSSREIQFYEPVNGMKLATLPMESSISSLSFSADGRLLIITQPDGTIRFYGVK